MLTQRLSTCEIVCKCDQAPFAIFWVGPGDEARCRWSLMAISIFVGFPETSADVGLQPVWNISCKLICVRVFWHRVGMREEFI